MLTVIASLCRETDDDVEEKLAQLLGLLSKPHSNEKPDKAESSSIKVNN